MSFFCCRVRRRPRTMFCCQSKIVRCAKYKRKLVSAISPRCFAFLLQKDSRFRTNNRLRFSCVVALRKQDNPKAHKRLCRHLANIYNFRSLCEAQKETCFRYLASCIKTSTRHSSKFKNKSEFYIILTKIHLLLFEI